jgi:hypothetical protein
MYQIKNLRNVRMDKHDGKIYFEFDGQPDEVFLDIRAGIVWPYQIQPGYWLIIGQREKETVFGKHKHPLTLLDDGESRDLDKLFDSMTDSAVRLKCENIYANMNNEENQCYREAFSHYCREHNIQRVFLNRAHYVDNFEYGVQLIRQFLRDQALELDRASLVADQLGQIPESALEEDRQREYYALQALRFVLASFVKSPWRPPMQDVDYGPLENYPGYYPGIDI